MVFLCLQRFKRVLYTPSIGPGEQNTGTARITPAHTQDVEKQFALVERHILRLRSSRAYEDSEIVIMCERNLGFESEHLQRALNGLPNVWHRIDHAAQRYGIIMNEEV